MDKEKLNNLMEESKSHYSQYVEEYKNNEETIKQLEERNKKLETIVAEIRGRYGLLQQLLSE